MSEQQTLILPLPVQKHYGNWVKHTQVEGASGRLALWFVQGGLLWLSSSEVAGKSHFLQALGEEHPHVAMLQCDQNATSSVHQLKLWLEACEFQAYWVLDLPEGVLAPVYSYAVFHLIERAKEMNRSLLISWRCGEGDLQPPELSSRLLMMERADMAAPSDDAELNAVLQSVLQTMQWDMKDTVLPTLLQHVPRNLSALLEAIAQLDVYSRKHRVNMNAALALRVLNKRD
ncbi:MAG: hypothetical protein R8M46_06340 [Ghiorsea sp.]